MRTLVALVSLACISGRIAAQASAEQLSRCAAINAPALRLRCFDQLAVSNTSLVADTVMPEVAAMRSDLRNLVTAEESYFADSLRYTKSLRALHFRPSPGVTVTIDQVVGEAWRGTAKHSAAPEWVCGIYVGSLPPYLPGQKEAVPRCWKKI
jgi:hypothetical protein